MSSRFLFPTITALLLLPLLTIPSCKQDSEPQNNSPTTNQESVTPAEPVANRGNSTQTTDPQDPGSSPEALLAYIRTVLEERPVPYRKWFDMFYIRTPIQEKWRQYITQWEVPRQELEQAIKRYFNPGVTFSEADLWPHLVMEITSRSEDRAEAVCKDDIGLEGGREEILYFIKVEGEWRLSADTFEASKQFPEEYFKSYSLNLESLPAAMKDIIRRMEAGEFAGPAEVRGAASRAFDRIKTTPPSTAPAGS